VNQILCDKITSFWGRCILFSLIKKSYKLVSFYPIIITQRFYILKGFFIKNTQLLDQIVNL
jgi:hypothetical protein